MNTNRKRTLKFLCGLVCVTFSGLYTAINAQNLGLMVDRGYSVLFGESTEGAGSKMIWNDNRSTLIAGHLNSAASTYWDLDSLGAYSLITGQDNRCKSSYGFTLGNENISNGTYAASWGWRNEASSVGATAWGADNKATSNRSTVWGINNISSSLRSTAWGEGNEATGTTSTCWGSNNKSQGGGSTVWGGNNEATGNSSTALGVNNDVGGFVGLVWGENNTVNGLRATGWGEGNEAIGRQSTVWGEDNDAKGELTTTYGKNNFANSFLEVVIGQYADTMALSTHNSWVFNEHLFVVGTGFQENQRHNSFTILKDGRLNIHPNNADRQLEFTHYVNGTFSEPMLAPESANWGYLGSDQNYFNKIYSNSFFATSLANYLAFSDKRLKKNIERMEDGISIIKQLNPVSYLLKNENHNLKSNSNNDIQYGLIAQEVEEILPSLVFEHPSSMKSVSYVGLIPFIIKGVQEQNDYIEQLEETNNNLTKRIKLLESQMAEVFQLINK